MVFEFSLPTDGATTSWIKPPHLKPRDSPKLGTTGAIGFGGVNVGDNNRTTCFNIRITSTRFRNRALPNFRFLPNGVIVD